MGCLCQFFKTQRDNAAPFGSSWAPPTTDFRSDDKDLIYEGIATGLTVLDNW